MCTAISFQTIDHYFGRNLDVEHSYGESVVVTPRKFPFHFRCGKILQEHYAMIGMAAIRNDYPLYFEATNEKGRSMAGLNFPGNAVYFPPTHRKHNITPFELIPWTLAQFDSVASAMPALRELNITDIPFSEQLPLSPLHWFLTDKEESVTIESTKDGLQIYENSAGILTNNPPFPYHMHNLVNYINLTPQKPENRFSKALELVPFSLGMGAIGLPGDLSSPSRYIRAAFTKFNSVCNSGETESVSQFFHILGSVTQQRGLTCLEENVYEYTLYSSCCNTDKGIYYYTTYENSQITAVHMNRADLSGTAPIVYPLITDQQIRNCN